MPHLSRQVTAVTKIQGVFRKWRARCHKNGFFPSDENPYHWK